MKTFPILGIAAIAIGASSSLAQAAIIKNPRPPIIINNEFPLPAIPPTGNLVNNPGFETGNFNGYSVFDPSGQSLVDNGSLVPGFSPHSGNYQAALGPAGVGILSQAIPTTVGQRYELSYFLANSDTTGNNSFETVVGGNIVFPQQALPAQNYTLYTFPFAATSNSNSTDLEFVSQNTTAFFFLDDISVVPASVPEPSELFGTLAFGALGVGCLIKRQCQSKNNLN